MTSGTSRRDFLRKSGAAACAAALVSCGAKKDTDINLDPDGHHTGEIPTDKMTYRINPKQGDKVSLLGYGYMRLPTTKGGSARTQENVNADVIDQEECNRLTKFALDHGVNYFDTSPAYCRGRSEESLGIALQASGYRRDQYFIATKLSNFAQSQWSLEEGKAMFERSLQYLQTDYIDYLLLHAIGSDMDNLRNRYLDNGLLDWLAEQREAGRIRNLGFSFHGQASVYDYALSLHDKYHWDFVQIQANYCDWHNKQDKGRDGEYLYNELARRDIPVVIMEPLLGGRLSKVPDCVVAHLKGSNPRGSVASWAFRYIGSKPAVLTVLSGMTYMEHLEDNLRSYSPLVPLTEEEQLWLEGETASLIKDFPTIDCNDCKYCMPCPYGLDIPGVFTHYNKCVNQGHVPESREAKDYQEARRAFLVGYDRSVPRLRQADHCVGCRECVSHCPQNIDIPREMERINRFVEKLKQDD
ncbi:MAG: aldo/keto reductase [Bacteroidaceae bacterium]|nr:aldo/keto reductase [Bacteroidaceae bacterium]